MISTLGYLDAQDDYYDYYYYYYYHYYYYQYYIASVLGTKTVELLKGEGPVLAFAKYPLLCGDSGG